MYPIAGIHVINAVLPFIRIWLTGKLRMVMCSSKRRLSSNLGYFPHQERSIN